MISGKVTNWLANQEPGTQSLIVEQAELKYRTPVLLIDLVPGGSGIVGSVGDGLGSLHK